MYVCVCVRGEGEGWRQMEQSYHKTLAFFLAVLQNNEPGWSLIIHKLVFFIFGYDQLTESGSAGPAN